MCFRNFMCGSFLSIVLLTNCKKAEFNENDQFYNVDSVNYSQDRIDSLELNSKVEENNAFRFTNFKIEKYSEYGTNYHIFFSDGEGNEAQYDDDANYLDLPNLRHAMYIPEILYNLEYYYNSVLGKKSQKDGSKYRIDYTDEYIDFLNSKINLVYDLPLKTEDKKLDEIFNTVYYDLKPYTEIYVKEQGYGRVTFVLSDEYATKNEAQVELRRDEKTGNLTLLKW